MITSARSVAWSLARMLVMLLRMVLGDRNSCWAICGLDRPAAMRSSTSVSRSVSSGNGRSGRAGGVSTSAIRAAKEAPKTTPPPWTVEIARTISSCSAPLRR
jgi:hypothetical protein